MRDSDWLSLSILYEHKNISKAAEALFISQPTLSKRIQKIEEDLDTKLLVRNAQGVTFTAEGEYLAQKAMEVIKLFEEIDDTLNKMKQDYITTLKVGMPNSFARFNFPSIMNQTEEVFPRMRIEVTTELSSTILRYLQEGKIDIGFIKGNHSFNGMKHLLSSEAFYIVSKNPIQLQDLPNLPQIDFAKDKYAIELIDEWWNQHFSQPPNIFMTVNHGDTSRELVQKGLGYGIFPVLDYFTEFENIHTIPLTYNNQEPVVRNTWMVYNENARNIPHVKQFIEYILALEM